MEDAQEQLEHEREMRGNSSIVKSLKNQLEEVQTSEASSVKSYKRLQGDMDELQLQYDEVVRSKSEVRACGMHVACMCTLTTATLSSLRV